MANIQFLGHATVLITTEENKKVIIDPFLEGNPMCPDELKNPEQIDYILLTHGHADHASSAASLAKKHNAITAATYELANLLVKDGAPDDKTLRINKGGTTDLPGSKLKITLTNAFHSSSYDAVDGNTYYAGEAGGIILHLENGKTIYHAGDTCLFSDMKQIGERYKPEIALLPIGDCFTMGPEEATEAAKLIQANTVIPIHHSTFPPLTGTPSQFQELMAETAINVAILEPGQSI